MLFSPHLFYQVSLFSGICFRTERMFGMPARYAPGAFNDVRNSGALWS